ncbi:hypothetical protein DO97_13585 [Neosynechococcus sphagnicola sy1]|uniref:Uncharacterized protein n=1 Tax=Neosynechococcus sphagnicola sy1 TaxID=1497020 RepID=A0A098THJ1_9CYAN|nr:hypothetical protein [Neosynechococcus sphagnicola]KGF72045.1 hypothetical protein DO97_13585 [Neosynechococcus sphagnicola sy1]
MSPSLLNGNTAPGVTQPWLQQSVRQFLIQVNWEDHPPAVQELKVTALQGSSEPLSLLLKVADFFMPFLGMERPSPLLPPPCHRLLERSEMR